MRGPHVRFCERREGAILRAYSTDRSRCWPNGLGLRPRITEGNELAMGSSCGPLLARDQRISEMAGALNPRRPPKIQTRFRRPIPMARPVSPLVRERMNRGNVTFAENFGHIA